MDGTAVTAKSGGVLRARLRRVAPVPSATAAVPPPPPPGVERVAATAVARAAGRAGGLHARAEAVVAQGISLAELHELLPERALIAVIESGGDRLGVAALCPAFLASLIEMQAIGRVTARPVGARRATRADAALAAEFVNHLLEEVGQSVAALPGHGALAGYRYASYLDDPRPLGLMLDDTGLRALHIELRLGAGGERRGTLFLAVPATVAGDAPAPAVKAMPAVLAAPQEAPAPPATAAHPPSLADAVRDAPVPLVAVLCRRQITLRELRALRPGATIALPRAALDDARLETARGQKLARGKLGEADGFHALRLRHRDAPSSAPDADLPVVPVPLASVPVLSNLPQMAPLSREPHAPGLAPLAAEPPIADLAEPDAFRAGAHDAAQPVPGAARLVSA